MVTRIITRYTKPVGRRYLVNILSPIIRSVCKEENVHYEVSAVSFPCPSIFAFLVLWLCVCFFLCSNECVILIGG